MFSCVLLRLYLCLPSFCFILDFIPEEEEVYNTSSIERFARQDATEELVVCASDVEEGVRCWADQVYRLCAQDGPLPFQNCYPERSVLLLLQVLLACLSHS